MHSQHNRLRGLLTFAASLLVALAMLAQPLCAPICAAWHCPAKTQGATHCGPAADSEGASISALRMSCPNSETLALPSSDGQRLRRADASTHTLPFLSAEAARLSLGALTSRAALFSSPGLTQSRSLIAVVLRL